MKLIVMGSGRVGVQVARLMDQENHDVSVIDNDEIALERLGKGFHGQIIQGLGFDRDVLIKAGIETAEAFAATSNSDNANIIAARIARNIFHVPRVVAALYDVRRAEIYRRLGLLTFSSTQLGAERIRELLTFPDLDPIMIFGGGEVVMVTLEILPIQEGKQVRDFNVPGEIDVISITRHGVATLPAQGTTLKNGDIVYLAILASSMKRLKAMLGYGEGE